MKSGSPLFLRCCLAMGLACLVQTSAAQSPATVAALRFSYVIGAGGVPLSVAEAGDSRAPAILFIHGLGQSHLSFERQLHSALAEHFHLVAFDLRGHGNSAKPWDAAAYTDSHVLAEDVANVMQASGLEKPVIVAWSYGTLVTADYIRHHGTDGLSGVLMIGALGGLASLPPSAFDPKFMAQMQELRQLSSSPGLEDTLQASREIVPLLTSRPMSTAWTARSESIGAMLPPFARSALNSRMLADNTDLVARVHVPMLLLAGSEDHGTPRALMQKLSDALPLHATVMVYEGSGHSPFVEEAERFNADLSAFASKAFSGK